MTTHGLQDNGNRLHMAYRTMVIVVHRTMTTHGLQDNGNSGPQDMTAHGLQDNGNSGPQDMTAHGLQDNGNTVEPQYNGTHLAGHLG